MIIITWLLDFFGEDIYQIYINKPCLFQVSFRWILVTIVIFYNTVILFFSYHVSFIIMTSFQLVSIRLIGNIDYFPNINQKKRRYGIHVRKIIFPVNIPDVIKELLTTTVRYYLSESITSITSIVEITRRCCIPIVLIISLLLHLAKEKVPVLPEHLVSLGIFKLYFLGLFMFI